MQKLIVFIANTDGGVATYIRNFLKFRPAGRFYIRLVIVDDQSSIRPLSPKDFEADETRFISFHKRENLYHLMKQLSINIDGPGDILLCNERIELSMVNLLRLPNPVISIIHGDSMYYYESVTRYQGVVDGFIATSRWIADKIKTITDGLNIPCQKIFAPVPPIAAGSDSFRLPVQILYAGRLDSSKGVHHIPGICRLLDEWGIAYSMTIVGEGELLEPLQAESRSLKGEFVFPGFVANENISQVLAGKHVLLFPSYSEALGIVVVEAMKGGLIPVVSELPSGIPEFVFNGVTGLTAPVGDESAFATQIRWLVSDPEERPVMRGKAIEISNRLFDAHTQSAAIADYILSATANRPAKRFVGDRYGFRLDSRFIPNPISVFIRRIRDLIQIRKRFTLYRSNIFP